MCSNNTEPLIRTTILHDWFGNECPAYFKYKIKKSLVHYMKLHVYGDIGIYTLLPSVAKNLFEEQ